MFAAHAFLSLKRRHLLWSIQQKSRIFYVRSTCPHVLGTWYLVVVEVPAGVTDTMLTATDFLEDNEHQNILNVAPVEGNRPLSIFRDKHSEELAYPGIFLGQKRPENEHCMVKVHYSDICKSELYKTKKLEMKIILGKSQIALRKCKGNSRSLNVGRLKQWWRWRWRWR